METHKNSRFGFFTREKMTSRVTYHEFAFGNGNNKFCVKRKSN